MKHAGFSLLFLFLGTLIYCICRQDVVFLLPFQGSEILETIKIDIHYNGNPLVYFLLFCLSDALWFLSLLLFQMIFYNEKSIVSKVLFMSSVSLPFVLEFLQIFFPHKGTFCYVDLFSYVLILILVLWIERKKLFCV